MNQRRAIISSYVGVMVIASVIFIAGGQLLYWQAWLYVGLALLGTTLTHMLAPKEGNLAARRATQARAGEAWDRRIVGIYFLLSIVTFVIGGLDSGRFEWSGPVPLAATALGALAMLAGQLLFALARRENTFFASTVQIETERSHAVCATGPYRVVRHPGYLGMFTSMLGFPLVIGSYWAFIPAALALVLLLLRVSLEDRFLSERLAGYGDYAHRVRYRLIPFMY